MTAISRNTVQQSIEEIFVQMMNDIYYPGYAEEIDPERIEFEFEEFRSQFSEKR